MHHNSHITKFNSGLGILNWFSIRFENYLNITNEELLKIINYAKMGKLI